MLGVNEKIERLPPLGYRSRILVCAAAATGIPLLLLLGQEQVGPALIAGGAAIWFLFCVHRLLLPLRSLTSALDACVASEPLNGSEPLPNRDEIERMMANIDRIAERLDIARRRELEAATAGLAFAADRPSAQSGRSAAR